jgi:phosphatidylserine decarboxylase
LRKAIYKIEFKKSTKFDMKISKFGLDNFKIRVLISLAIFFIAIFVVQIFLLSIVIAFLGFFLLCFTFWFFRDPKRNVPIIATEDESIVVSPADGKVVEIKEIVEHKFFKSEARQISIFLSPIDVHVNRAPITGKVVFFEYNAGNYFVAYHPKASELNEHTFIGVENKYGKLAFKQITGILARRIVCILEEGKDIEAGEKIGMMKFGSRMDIIVPLDSEIFVQIQQKVKGGETIIARLRKDIFPTYI